MFTPVDMCAHAVGAAAKSRASARMLSAGMPVIGATRSGVQGATKARRPSTLRPWSRTACASKPTVRSISASSAASRYTSVSGRIGSTEPAVAAASMRRGFTYRMRAPRACAAFSAFIGWAIDRKDMCETAGFSPISRMKSERSMSGTGCRVRVPNTACDPANLFEQSWVPELKCLRTPSWPMKRAYDGPCRLLNAAGLPT